MVFNPFSGIITPELHTTYNNMIDAILEDEALTTNCKFVFGNCVFVDCDNCSRGKYVPGGPLYFPSGKLCPLCFGKGGYSVESSEEHWLCVEFSSQGWMTTSGKAAHRTGNIPKGAAETLCKIEHYQRIVSCEHIVLDKNNECLSENRYKRIGRPESCGFGDKTYIFTFWEQVSG